MNEQTTDRLWNVRDLASYLHTTEHAVYKLVERRQVPVIRLGRKILFHPKAIRAWLAEQAVAPRIQD